jgi:hypothetical protein
MELWPLSARTRRRPADARSTSARYRGPLVRKPGMPSLRLVSMARTRDRVTIKGASGDRRSAIDPVIRRSLADASGISLDLRWDLT